MKTDLYETLGIDKKADKVAMKKAYRKRAMETHTDRQGDRAEFEAVKNAWMVLSDDAARKRYDETGEWEEKKVDNAWAVMVNVLGAVLRQVIVGMAQNGTSPKTRNVVDEMRRLLDGQIKEKTDKKAEFECVRKTFMETAGRFETKETDNVLDLIVKSQLAELDMVISAAAKDLEPFVQAAKVLKKFTFKHEQDKHSMSGIDPQKLFGQVKVFWSMPG